jgi:hypothetical protein
MGALIPLKNGIQILGMGMDPGFHRGDDSRVRGKDGSEVDFQSTL